MLEQPPVPKVLHFMESKWGKNKKEKKKKKVKPVGKTPLRSSWRSDSHGRNTAVEQGKDSPP